MTVRSSRTYKLKLSRVGISLYLECHCRLCHLVEDLLPYGITLYVAMRLLEIGPVDEVIGDMISPELTSLGGREVRLVGTSPDLAETTKRIADRIVETESLYPPPQTWKLYLAALMGFRSSEDGRIVKTYLDIVGQAGSGH